MRLDSINDSPATGCVSANARCSSCDKRVRFVLIYEEQKNGNYTGYPVYARMFPAPVISHETFLIPETVPEPLRKAFEQTVECYNAQLWGATATTGRRTLEGIFKYMLPEDQRTLKLYQLIEAATKEVDLVEPLERLANAIRQGGNLGAHFDFDNEPNAEVSGAMVKLLQYLIEYIYVLPNQIKELEEQLGESK